MTLPICSECGTRLQVGKECRDYFNQMLEWDFANPIVFGQVHHLTVLCYYLQHPSQYSVKGLKKAIHILQKVVENNLSDTDIYQEESDIFSSSNRNWSVTGSHNDFGKYTPEIKWTLTVSEIVKDGIAKYPQQVKEWSRAIYTDLKVTGNLA